MRAQTFFLFASITVFVGLEQAPLGAAPVPKHLMKEPEGDKARLQGKWKLESLIVNGTPPLGELVDLTFEFRGDKVTATDPDCIHSGTIKLSVVEGVKVIAITNTTTMGKMGAPKPWPDAAFGYVLDGDKLTMTSSSDETKPVDPKKADDKGIVGTLVRIKEKQ